MSDHSQASDLDSLQIMADIRSVYEQLPGHGRSLVAIRGAHHSLFSDDGALLKSALVRRTLRLLGLLDIDGRRQLAVTAYCVHSFFDAHLARHAPHLQSSRRPLYPEIRLLR